MGAQKDRLIETVLLSTHNICFGWEIEKIIFSYVLLSGDLLNVNICPSQDTAILTSMRRHDVASMLI